MPYGNTEVVAIRKVKTIALHCSRTSNRHGMKKRKQAKDATETATQGTDVTRQRHANARRNKAIDLLTLNLDWRLAS